MLLGIQVANFSGSLLKEQTLANVGLAARVEANRVQGSVAALSTNLDSVIDEHDIEQLLVRQTGSLVGAASTEFADVVEVSYGELETSGLTGLELRVVGHDRYAAGVISPQSIEEGELIGLGDTRIGEVFFIEGRPRLTVVRQIWATPTKEGVAARLVSEWDLETVLDVGLDISDFGPGARLVYLAPHSDGSLNAVYSTDGIGEAETVTLADPPVAAGSAVVAETIGIRGTDVVQASARSEHPAWITVIEADPDFLFAGFNRIRLAQIAVFVGAGMVIIGVIVLAMRPFVRRLANVTDLAEAVADGDLTVRTGDDRYDELGRLSMAFDDMAEALAHDIARRERVEAQLAYQATHDSLTGLPNRQQLSHALDTMLAESDALVSVLFLDLDGFKAVNDRLGHAAGDELLVRVADRLRGVIRQGDFVARLGGDEFVVVLVGLGALEAEQMAERIVAVLEAPIIVSDEECLVSASIGVSSAIEERSSERLIKEADIAMYRAKALGKGRAVRATAEAMNEVNERLSLINDLRWAVQNDEFNLLYWPIGDLRRGSLVGLEATVRWNHPTRGELAPADFLPLAQSAGSAIDIDEWVIRACVAQFAAWLEEGLPIADLQMSFNLTTEMFLNPRARQVLIETLDSSGLKASNFRVEVPEPVLRGEGSALREVFDTFRAIGLAVTLDRFGTDYANLDRLPRFAIDAVKVDLTLISDLRSRLSSRTLVSSLITLARTAGLRVSAAGVDDSLLRDELVELGCTVGQGLWLSPAVTADEFADLARSRFLIDAG